MQGVLLPQKAIKYQYGGVTAGSFNHIIYEATPTIKSHIGNLTKVES